MSRRGSVLVLAVAATLGMVVPARAAEVVEAVVATVDGEPILLGELRALPGPQTDATLAERLERRIELLLLEHWAREQQVEIDERAIDAAIARIADQNGLTTEELYDLVASQGLTRDRYRALVREQLLRQRVVATELEPLVQLDDADLLAYMRRHAARYSEPPRVEIAVAVVPGGPERALPCAAEPACPEAVVATPPRGVRLLAQSVVWDRLAPVVQRWLARSPPPGTMRWFRIGDRWLLVRFDALVPGRLKPLDAVRDEVLAAAKAERLEELYRSWLARRKEAAWIQRFPLPVSE